MTRASKIPDLSFCLFVRPPSTSILSSNVKSGRLAQSGASVTANQEVAGSSPGPATYFRGDL